VALDSKISELDFAKVESGRSKVDPPIEFGAPETVTES